MDVVDPVTAGWIIRFFIHRSSIDERRLKSLIRALPLPADDLDLQKSLLLFQLEREASVSKSTLCMLEQLEEIEFRRGSAASAALRHAFCGVAVDCALRPLKRNDAMAFYSAVKGVWKQRIPMMERVADNGGLRSEMLEAWKRDIDAAAWDDAACRNVLEKFEGVRAEEMVRVYVREEMDKIGLSFLDIVGEKVKVKMDDLEKVARVMGIDLESPVKVTRKLVEGSRSTAANTPPGKRRRRNRRWSKEEEDALRAGVAKFGKGYWKMILNDNRDVFEERTEVDLKDKWRNMTP